MVGRVVYLSDTPAPGAVQLFDCEPDVMSVPKVAELLDVSPITVRREIARGNLEVIHIGSAVRITKTALLRYMGEAGCLDAQGGDIHG